MQFFLFVLANAMLFIRPSELLAEVGDLELYRYAIVACLVVSLPVVVQQLFVRCAGVPPIAGCVLGLLPAVLLSHISRGNADEALEQGIEFGKVLAYFLLLLGLVTTTPRLRQFLCWLVLFSAAVTTIAVLRYHTNPAAPAPVSADAAPRTDGKNSKIHNISVPDEMRDPVTGDVVTVQRMCGTGI